MSALLNLTHHARTRTAQRGITSSDIDLLTLIGTQVESGYLVREKDFQAFEKELKGHIQQARKLVGKRVVIEGDRVITAYHTNSSKARRLLRQVDERSLEN